jgi:hypothetical protein
MKVFISWSGPISRETGGILRDLLPCMLQGLEVFLSKHDIHSGTRWGLELARELESTSFGILCLTGSNQTSPWLLYEAGALTRQLEARACGLLLGELTPANVSGPLAQFQHRRMIGEDFLLLLRDLNSGLTSPLDPEQVSMIFSKWWPDVDARYQEALTSASAVPRAKPERTDRELLEEVLERMRATGGKPKNSDPDYDPLESARMGFQRLVIALPQPHQELLTKITALKKRGDHEAATALCQIHHVVTEDLIAKGFARFDEDGTIRINSFLARDVLI